MMAAGILDAGGRNCTMALRSRSGYFRRTAIVGLALFTQYWCTTHCPPPPHPPTRTHARTHAHMVRCRCARALRASVCGIYKVCKLSS